MPARQPDKKTGLVGQLSGKTMLNVFQVSGRLFNDINVARQLPDTETHPDHVDRQIFVSKDTMSGRRAVVCRADSPTKPQIKSLPRTVAVRRPTGARLRVPVPMVRLELEPL